MDKLTREMLCDCKKGFVANKDFMCDIAYEGECAYSEDLELKGGKNSSNFVCERAAGLRFKDGRCRCKNDFDSYVEEERRCVARLGYPCKGDDDCASSDKCEAKEDEGSHD